MKIQKMQIRSKVKQQKGATLIEALISLLIFSIGLLGISGLILSSLAQQGIAQGRTNGAQLASDLAERMRANSLSTIGPSDYITPNVTTYAQAVAYTAKQTAAMASQCTTTACTAAQIAASDMATWLLNVKDTLPSGIGIVQAGNEPSERLIIVAWNAKNASATDQKFSTASAANCPAALDLATAKQDPATFRCALVRFMP